MFWALVEIEHELGAAPSQSLKAVVLAAMHRDPRHWKAYYTEPRSQSFDMQYSLSDRIRYYWNVPEVRTACEALIANLSARRIPLTLLSQYLPRQYAAIREGSLANDARALLLDGVAQVLRTYASACHPAGGARTFGRSG
jgi:D-tagatose-1,6-bisphosphate aldolase subunit GatZ/KbaZ